MHKTIALVILLTMISTAHASPPDDADKIMSHMEFLGYEVAKNEKRISAKHTKRLNIAIRKYKGGILFTTFLSTTDFAKKNKTSLLEFVNKLNFGATAVRYYTDKDDDIVVEGWFPGKYEKARFGLFLDGFNQVPSQIYENIDVAKKYLK